MNKRRGACVARRVARTPVLILLLVLMHATGTARAGKPAGEVPPALFALVIGVNAGPSPDVAPLRYADDDAARFLDLFRSLGARTYVLSHLDANTRRLHPQAAAEAVAPRRAELRQAAEALARDIAQAHARGVKATLYVVYAGHGDVRDSVWYLTLEDGPLSGADLLTDVVERADADESHVIVDACQAYLLALPRGPGGMRRAVRGFFDLEAAANAGRIGYLLSSSLSGESHEWEGFEGGVFSHEVRSGLYGAADADGDGRVTYPEIAAFVARANEGIVSDRYRPQVFARAPKDDTLLLDLRSSPDRPIDIDGKDAGAHYLLENEQGVRVLDFHGDGVTPVRLRRPPGQGPLYLRNLTDGTERTIPRTDGPSNVANIAPVATRTQSRGAAHQAFTRLFELPFDAGVVAIWTRREAELSARAQADETSREAQLERQHQRRLLGFAALGLGAAAAIASVSLEISAHNLHDDAPSNEIQRDVVARNGAIDTRNHAALAVAGAAALSAGLGAWLLWSPISAPGTTDWELAASLSTTGAEIGARGRF
jgi:hypothetical protein